MRKVGVGLVEHGTKRYMDQPGISNGPCIAVVAEVATNAYCPACTKVAIECDQQRDELQRLIDSGGSVP